MNIKKENNPKGLTQITPSNLSGVKSSEQKIIKKKLTPDEISKLKYKRLKQKEDIKKKKEGIEKTKSGIFRSEALTKKEHDENLSLQWQAGDIKGMLNTILSKKLNESKWLKDVKPKPGKMKALLGIPKDETIMSHYKSGKKLAKDLLKALDGDKKEVAGMLAFAANATKRKDIFDTALKSLSDK